MPVPFPFPAVSKANTRINPVQTDSKIKKKLCALCKPIAGYRKLEIELLFLKKLNTPDWNVLSVKGGSEWGGPLVGCRLKFSHFVGSRLKFSIFVGSWLKFSIFVGCR